MIFLRNRTQTMFGCLCGLLFTVLASPDTGWRRYYKSGRNLSRPQPIRPQPTK